MMMMVMMMVMVMVMVMGGLAVKAAPLHLWGS